MKSVRALALILTAPLLLGLSVWQGGRFSARAAELRKLEAAQKAWVEENEKLAGGIAVLSSRERAAAVARELGLQKASPERRLIVRPRPAQGGRSDG